MFYKTIEEYMQSPHGRSRYSYGSDWLPKVHIKEHKRSAKLRRKIAIHAYVGMNGSGKSLAMVHDTLIDLAGKKWKCTNREHYHFKVHGTTEGYRMVLSTVKLVDPRTGAPHPLYIPYTDHRQLLTMAEHCTLLFDEVLGLASTDASFGFPVQVSNVLMQLRRRDVILRWTAPQWVVANPKLRQVTRAVTHCKGMFPIPEAGRDWASNIFFMWKTYDAANFENFNIGTQNRILPETFETYLRTRKHNLAESFYDSLAPVDVVEAINEVGMCMHCAGKRTIPTCKCDRDVVDTEENYVALTKEFERKAKGLGPEADAAAPPAPLHSREASRTGPALFPAVPTIILPSRLTRKEQEK
jgi:hypothetical protein